MRARRRTSSGCSLADRARQRAASSTGRAYRAAEAAVPRHARVRRLSARGADRLHRLDAVLLDLGVGRQIPGDPRRRERRRGGALAVRRRARRCSTQIVDERWFRRGGVSASGRPTRSATTSRSMPTKRAASRSRRCTRCASRSPSREGRANVALADFVAPQGPDAGLHRRVRRHRRHRRGRGRRALQACQRRLLVDHGQGAGGSAGGSLRRAAAPARAQGVLGLCAGRDAAASRADRREVSRHPSGAGLSGAARPHREGHAVPAARRRARSA